MDYNRLYEYRFKNVDKQKKLITWKVLAEFLNKELNYPSSVIDPAAGECEFINAIAVKEKWAVDLNYDFITKHADNNIKVITGDSLDVKLPDDYFDAAFISNFLEHLNSQEEIHQLLLNIYCSLRKGGRIAVMGPNFKYCQKEYFDFADHKMILTHLSLEEHLYCSGFNILKTIPRFLPVSFRSRLPVNKFIVNTYVSLPVVWKFFGQQFLIIAEK
jgi:SAM-dependent methyltransferase